MEKKIEKFARNNKSKSVSHARRTDDETDGQRPASLPAGGTNKTRYKDPHQGVKARAMCIKMNHCPFLQLSVLV